MTVRDTAQSVRLALLVGFTWGAGGSLSGPAYYTDWDNDLVVGGVTYTSAPEMALRAGQLDGGVGDKPWTLSFLPTRSPINKLIRPYAWATVYATIAEYDPVTAEAPRTIFGGRLSKAKPNASGQRGLVQVEVSGWKSYIQYPVGIETGPGCPWTVYDPKTCKLNPATFTQTALITGVSGVILSAPSLVMTGGDANWFTRGTVTYDGLTISVRDSSSGAAQMICVQLPPPEWVGVTASFLAGCDRLPSTCLHKFNNIARFAGIGTWMPDHNPQVGGGG